jgi:hypothetical protein
MIPESAENEQFPRLWSAITHQNPLARAWKGLELRENAYFLGQAES